MSTAAPTTATEADSLRAYVPTATLKHIAELSNEECAAAEKRRKANEEACKIIAECKERMRKDRATIKEMERRRKAYFASPLFGKTDAARDAAWAAARIARDAALAAGEAPMFETQEECTKRVKGA